MTDATGPYFAPVSAQGPDRPGSAIGCGRRGQNAPAIRALLDCLDRRLPIHAGHGAVPIRAAAPRPAPLLYCQSSGSGGQVRTIRRSHGSWISSFEINRTTFALTVQDSYGVLGQLGHSLSLYATLEALHLGAGLQVLAQDSPRSQIRQLVEGRTSVLYATPMQMRRLQLAADRTLLPGIRHIFSGGGRLDPHCRAGMSALCPNATIREFYGTSETSFITIADETTPEGSVGRAYPGVQIRIGQGGQISVASPYLFDGYDDAPIPPRDDDFILTGDLGDLDGAGYLFLRGRLARMLTIMDRNLSLEDVETVMTAAGAGFCAAVAVPDPQRGHIIIAVVEGAADDALARRLRHACRTALGDHAAPRRILFVPQLPQLAADKPDLAAISRLVAAIP